MQLFMSKGAKPTKLQPFCIFRKIQHRFNLRANMESAHQFSQIQMTSQQSFQNGNIHVCVLSYSEKGSIFFHRPMNYRTLTISKTVLYSRSINNINILSYTKRIWVSVFLPLYHYLHFISIKGNLPIFWFWFWYWEKSEYFTAMYIISYKQINTIPHLGLAVYFGVLLSWLHLKITMLHCNAVINWKLPLIFLGSFVLINIIWSGLFVRATNSSHSDFRITAA